MQRRNPTMSSLEAAALYLSQGKTTDVETAELMDQGKLLDPDVLERAYYRRALGFDFSTRIEEDRHKVVVTDDELFISTTATWVDGDDDGNARRMAKACIKLKKLHDAKLAEDAADLV